MAERSDVYAYFWVEGPVPAAEITSKMGIEPTEISVAGEKSRSGRISQRNSWELRSPLGRGDHLLQECLEALVPLLEARASTVKQLVESCSIGINCVGYYYGSNPGLHLSAELIARLAALGLPVDFDLYNYAGEDAL